MLDGWGAREIIVVVSAFLASLLFSTVVMVVLLLRLPANHLIAPSEAGRPQNTAQWLRKIAKNLFGGLLVLVGILLSLPGVPGQGLLTIFAGIILLDFPGKHRLERKLMGSQRMLSAVNRIRARYQKPPLEAPPKSSAESTDAHKSNNPTGDPAARNLTGPTAKLPNT